MAGKSGGACPCLLTNRRHTGSDFADALAYAMAHGDGWEVAGTILGRWTQLQAEEILRRDWGVIETREHCRMEATRLMEEIHARQVLPPPSTTE